jgi:5'(3')-deoxyribonucleotidase
MKKIALDVDGVLLKFMPAFDKAAEIVLGRKINVHKDEDKMDHYTLANRIDSTQAEVEEILEYMQTSRMYANLEAFEGAKEAVEEIKNADYEIYIVTALPEKAKEMRLENLFKALNLVPKDIYCVGMGLSKADALLELRPDIFIDDRVDYLVSAPFVFHLALIDLKESQKDKDGCVDVHVESLATWVKQCLPSVTAKLNSHYHLSEPLQFDIKLESVKRKLHM